MKFAMKIVKKKNKIGSIFKKNWGSDQQKKKWSIITTGIIFFCILVMLPVTLSMAYFFSIISTELESKAEKIAGFYVDKLLDKTANTMGIVRNTGFYLMEDDELRDVMSGSAELDPYELALVRNSIINSIPYYTPYKQKYITSVFLIKSDGTAISTFLSGIYKKESNRIKQVYAENKDFSATKKLVKSKSFDNYSYFILNYTDIRTMSPCGKIIIEIDTSELMAVDDLESIYQNVSVILSDDDNNILFMANDSEIPTEELFTKANRDNKAGFTYYTSDHEKYFHERQQVSNYKLKVDIFIPGAQIFRAENKAIVNYVIVAGVGILITLVCGFFFIEKIKKRLKDTVTVMDQMAEGDLSVRISPSGFQEPDDLIKAFNSMADGLVTLYDEAYTKGMLLRESEYKLLEAQINPHFIYNIMETINMRCMALGQKDICKMVTDLAELLRANIGFDGKQKITLRQEFNYARYYLELQKERFQDRLSYEIDYEDPAILEYYVPKLTIQPLIENSVVHGLENKKEGGTVRIKIWEEEESIYIKISDDGIGFDPNSLEQNPNGHSNNHVAVENIRRRIMLAYGDKGDMKIQSKPGAGTTILLIIPIERTES